MHDRSLARHGCPFARALSRPALLICRLLGVGSLLGIPAAGAAAPAQPPNIILIYADDLGWKDVGYQGTDFYETPNIDRLASEGMVFTSGYAGAGNCAPSRACLLSGQYTPRHGVYAVRDTKRGPVDQMRMEPVPNREYLPPAQLTVAEALKATGYATGWFGEWHLESDAQPGTDPKSQGFDTAMDAHGSGSGVREEPKDISALTKAACDFMTGNRGRPFFAYIAHHAVHAGHQARQATLDRFMPKPRGAQHTDPLYAACIAELDMGWAPCSRSSGKLALSRTDVSPAEPLRGREGLLLRRRHPRAIHHPLASGRTGSIWSTVSPRWVRRSPGRSSRTCRWDTAGIPTVRPTPTR